MCPGLTSPGAKLYPAETDTVVVSFYTWCWTWKLHLWNCPIYATELHIFSQHHNRKCLPHFKSLTYKFVFNKWIQAIMAEGKQQALCVGVMKMSADSMYVFYSPTFYRCKRNPFCCCCCWLMLLCPLQTERKSTRELASRTFTIWMTDCGTWRRINDDINTCNAPPQPPGKFGALDINPRATVRHLFTPKDLAV